MTVSQRHGEIYRISSTNDTDNLEVLFQAHLIRAQNLPRLDWPINDGNFVGQSDPFVKVKLVSEKQGGDVLEQVRE